MVAVGVVLLALYAAVAALFLWALSTLWSGTVGLATTVGVVVLATLAVAYLSYRYGTWKLLGGLDGVELPPSRAPELFRRIDRLAAAMDVDRPRVVVARLDEPNAFAVGGRGVVVVDRHLLSILELDELEGILAHELAHIESRDALVATLAYSALRALVGLALVALFPLVLLVTGLAKAAGWIRGRPAEWTDTLPGRVRARIERAVAVAMSAVTLLFLAHSRRREYAADDRAVEVTGDPVALARALAKIHRASGSPWDLLSMLRVTGDDETLRRLLSTHPPIDERIDRLLDRAGVERRPSSGPLRIPVR